MCRKLVSDVATRSSDLKYQAKKQSLSGQVTSNAVSANGAVAKALAPFAPKLPVK